MEFDLKRNARNFINESFHCIKRSKVENNIYPFAIAHLIQGLELTLKSLLSEENEMLVYENVDNPNFNKTVSISIALSRLVNFKIIDIEESDKIRLEKIINFRNQITHYKFKLNSNQANNYYLRLFEFLHYFYSRYLKIDLHDIIETEHWEIEADLLSQIKRDDFVHYHGTIVHKNHPKDIIDSQQYDGLLLDNEIYERVKFGNETTFKVGNNEVCGDCGVKKGFFHATNCDNEQCAKCGDQLIGLHTCDFFAYIVIGNNKPVPNIS